MSVLCRKCVKRLVLVAHQTFCRNVSTPSPLASVFNTLPSRKVDSRFRFKEHKGLLLIPELSDSSGFQILTRKVEIEVDDLVEEATSSERKRKIVQIFDELSNCICRVADMADFVRITHPDENYKIAAEYCVVSLSGLVEQLNTNLDIYNVLKHALEKGDVVPMDAVDRRVSELFKFDFDLSGCHLQDEEKEKYLKLSESIIMTGNLFLQGTQQPAAIKKKSLPEYLRHCFNLDGDYVVLNGYHPDNPNDQIREAAYRIYYYENPEQADLLDILITNRNKLAQLAGFPTYAHRALKGFLAETPETVTTFLDTLADRIRPSAENDYKAMLQLKKQHGSGDCKTLKPWDAPYYAALGRNLKYQVRTEEYAPYFSLGNCMEGLNIIFRSLYDVTLQSVEIQHGETWSHDVHKLAAVHRTEGILGYIYCDFFERSSKLMQDCHFTIQGGRENEDKSYELPVVVLNLTLSPPQNNIPSLLSPCQMKNLFHEFGHAMHSMLGRTRYQHVTGTRCSTDFAEIPSELMEYFASDPRVISSFARHFRSGEPLSMDAIHRLCQSNNMFSASEMQLQLVYSVLNQVLHGEHPLGKSTTDVLRETHNKYMGIPYIEGTAIHLRFGHLVGYGARYYSYLMSRAVASRIWHKCFKADPFSRKMGERYRHEVLAHGGGIPPKDLINAMLQETPTTDSLVESLVQHMES